MSMPNYKMVKIVLSLRVGTKTAPHYVIKFATARELASFYALVGSILVSSNAYLGISNTPYYFILPL